ncbi:protein of unknown function [Parapedobacter indicus]|uniref:eCIS core domain-containing protein n=2 Tax=Parapedobacter indicus TaxID=1477437 RepID=A0A1I3Q6P0_9SPHI|nr:uncharacterized protein DUF4157 [Parapedobacter indicus]SFJ29345.1 protein of unknown function [Parapedobacter indicus]
MLSPKVASNAEANVATNGVFFQPKLTVNLPGDKYEQEADAMADQVMRMIVQRKCKHCEEEEKRIQRKGTDSATPAVDEGFESYVASLHGRGAVLSQSERDFFEPRFGYDFSNVRIHTGGDAAQSADRINALAYTAGTHIVFNTGQYRPGSENGKRLLAHELTHVVQQGGSMGAIQRQTARRVAPNVVQVEHEGESYRVTRILESRRRGSGSSGSIDADIDRTNITITIKVCRDTTRGTVELGANIPESAMGVARRILDAVSRGAIGDIEGVLEGVDVTPFIEVLVARSGQFSITARGEVTVGLERVTGGAGSLGIRIGPLDIGIRGEGDDEGWMLGGNITVTPGRTDETFECTSVPLSVRLVCEKWHEASPYEITVPVPYRDTQNRFIYFDYASASIDRARSAQMLTEITTLLQEGYRVTRVTGHTSPEGPMQRGRRFEGNEQLGQSRATAALAEMESICAAQQLRMRDSRRCTADAIRDVQPIGLGELYTLSDDRGREIEGRRLAQHAVDQFKTSADESAHRTEELLEQMESMSLEQQRDTVYPLLRRATITLEKSGMRDEQVTLEEPAGYRSVGCPQAVETAARRQFSF